MGLVPISPNTSPRDFITLAGDIFCVSICLHRKPVQAGPPTHACGRQKAENSYTCTAGMPESRLQKRQKRRYSKRISENMFRAKRKMQQRTCTGNAPRQPGCIGQTGRTGRVTASLGEWSVIQKPAEKHRAINCEPTQHAAVAGIPDSFSGPRHYCNPDLSPHTEILPCREPQEAPAA